MAWLQGITPTSPLAVSHHVAGALSKLFGAGGVKAWSSQATLSLSGRPTPPSTSNMTREDYMSAVDQVKEHIEAGDIFQLVLSHRFQRRTFADPFEIYRHAAQLKQHPSAAPLECARRYQITFLQLLLHYTPARDESELWRRPHGSKALMWAVAWEYCRQGMCLS